MDEKWRQYTDHCFQTWSAAYWPSSIALMNGLRDHRASYAATSPSLPLTLPKTPPSPLSITDLSYYRHSLNFYEHHHHSRFIQSPYQFNHQAFLNCCQDTSADMLGSLSAITHNAPPNGIANGVTSIAESDEHLRVTSSTSVPSILFPPTPLTPYWNPTTIEQCQRLQGVNTFPFSSSSQAPPKSSAQPFRSSPIDSSSSLFPPPSAFLSSFSASSLLSPVVTPSSPKHLRSPLISGVITSSDDERNNQPLLVRVKNEPQYSGSFASPVVNSITPDISPQNRLRNDEKTIMEITDMRSKEATIRTHSLNGSTVEIVESHQPLNNDRNEKKSRKTNHFNDSNLNSKSLNTSIEVIPCAISDMRSKLIASDYKKTVDDHLQSTAGYDDQWNMWRGFNHIDGLRNNPMATLNPHNVQNPLSIRTGSPLSNFYPQSYSSSSLTPPSTPHPMPDWPGNGVPSMIANRSRATTSTSPNKTIIVPSSDNNSGIRDSSMMIIHPTTVSTSSTAATTVSTTASPSISVLSPETEKRTVQMNTTTVTLAPDYTIARDSNGQLYIFKPSTGSSCFHSSSLSIDHSTRYCVDTTTTTICRQLIDSTVTQVTPVNFEPSVRRPTTLVEQAIQTNITDDEYDEETTGNDMKTNTVTSSCQVDMDAEDQMNRIEDDDDDDDERKLNISSEDDSFVDVCNTSSAEASQTKIMSCDTLKILKSSDDEDDDNAAPALPVKSEEVMNFIKNRGLDLLVDSIENIGSAVADGETYKEFCFTVETKFKTDEKKAIDESDQDGVGKKSSLNSFTDGLNLLSALAEQRANEEKFINGDNGCIREIDTNVPDSLQRITEKEESKESRNEKDSKSVIRTEDESKAKIKSSKAKGKSESRSSSPRSVRIKDSRTTGKKLTDTEENKKKKKERTNQLDPWMIRRSERIFLSDAYQQSFFALPNERRSRKSSLNEESLSSETCNLNSNDAKSHKDADKITGDECTTKVNLYLDSNDLSSPQRVLIKKDDLLYAGRIQPIEPPDIYGLTLDGERSMNRHIYSREDILKEAIKEVKISSLTHIPEGCRVCAYWSQQYKCLYPGVVSSYAASGSSNSIQGNVKKFVYVGFDDGDKGRININDIRLLPSDFVLNEDDDAENDDAKEVNKTKRSLSRENKGSVKEKWKNGNNISMEIKLTSCDTDTIETNKRKNEQDSEKKNHKRHKNSHHQNRHDKKNHHPRNEKDTDKSKINPIPDSEQSLDVTEIDRKSAIHAKYQDLMMRTNRNSDEVSWTWVGEGYKRSPKSKKTYYDEMRRDDEILRTDDCALFFSSGRQLFPYVGRIDSMFATTNGTMNIRVRWFYHVGEVKAKVDVPHLKNALLESNHYDLNDVQTIACKCAVMPYREFIEFIANFDQAEIESIQVYFVAGEYDAKSEKVKILDSLPKV